MATLIVRERTQVWARLRLKIEDCFFAQTERYCVRFAAFGGRDAGVIELNKRAYTRLRCQKAMEVAPGATHLFPEPRAMEAVIALAGHWFQTHLMPAQNHAR
jgi:hypothetical protein